MTDDRHLSTSFLTPVRRLFIAAFVMDLAVAMVGLSIQFRGIELGATPMILGLLGTASSLAYTIGCLFTGRLSDRVGRRRLVGGSCLICAGVWLLMTRTGSPLQLLAVVPLSGGAISMFWPPLQAWLSEVTVGGRRRLIANVGTFNVAWTVGLMLGPPAAGFAWALGSAAPFFIAAVLVIGTLLLLSTTAERVEGRGEDASEDADEPRPDGEIARRFLYLAWIANFASWFGRGMNTVVFPKLGRELGFGESTIGLVVASLLAGQLLMFLYLRTRSFWQYRLWPLSLSLAVGVGGYLFAWFSHSPLTFAMSFALSGMGAGVTYVASLYYSLEGGADSRGGRTGVHEAVLGSGLFIGPLMGGITGDYLGLRAPYPATALVFLLTMTALYMVAARMSRPRTSRRGENVAEVTGK